MVTGNGLQRTLEEAAEIFQWPDPAPGRSGFTCFGMTKDFGWHIAFLLLIEKGVKKKGQIEVIELFGAPSQM